MNRKIRTKTKSRPSLRRFSVSRRSIETLEVRTVLSTGYLQFSLAADQPMAALFQDPNLNNPWGIALNANGGDAWVANSGSGIASQYQGDVGGSAFGLGSPPVTVAGGAPTGVVANGSSDFTIHSGASSGPASFLFDSASGEIDGWNTNVPPPSPSSTAVEATSIPGALYTGLALANVSGQNRLYAADFHDSRIDVFNSSFGRITLAGSFTDPSLPAGYAPYNIANIGGRLLVSYALQDAGQQNPVPGLTNGVVDAFDYNGNFLKTLIAGGPNVPTSKLNEPWGMAVAPGNFGDFSGELLVANSGDGKINAFDPNTGAYSGSLTNPDGNPLAINGLHGLAFGNGLTTGDGNTLFFTGVGAGGGQGLLGAIVSAQNVQFTGVGAEITPVSHVNFSGVVAVFNQAQPEPVGSYTADVNWGDGSLPEQVTVTALPSGGFAVSGSHTYFITSSSNVQENITVSIRDSANDSIVINGVADVAPPGLVFTPQPVTATEGLSFSGTITDFIDQDGFGNPAEYKATIDWGDGTTTASTVTASGTTMHVTGTHTYAHAGTEPIAVTVTDFDGAKGTAHITATVVTSLSGTAKTITPTETTAFNGTVAAFSDAHTGQPLTDYSATINWGDGTTTTGTVTTDGGGGFDVNGSHTYANAGTETVTVAISDPGSTITVLSTAKVADIDTLTATASPVSATQGTAFNGKVASFTDTRAAATPDQFSAAINWGDGTTTTGTITEASNTFTVSGTHNYAQYGAFTVKTTVLHTGGTATATVNSAASVADGNTLTMMPLNVTEVSGQTFTAALADVSDNYPGSVAGDFTASIDWGDGMSSAATVTGGNGSFTVSGTHAYATNGSFAPVVSMADNAPGTARASATAAVTVLQSAPQVTAVAVSGSEQTSLTVEVATFTQPGSSAGPSAYSATIAWGDGTTSQGIVSAAAAGFSVTGTHVYPDEGHYGFTVTVSNGGTSGSASGTATLVEPPLADGTAGTPVTRWINEVFTDLLHRPADAGALTFWSAAFSSGVARADLVFAIEGSAEYRGDEVNQVYQTYLHRSADPGGETFWANFLASNTVEELASIIIASPEYYQVRGGGTNDGFLNALFEDALHRPIDSGAKGYFDQLLAAGVSRQAIAASVLGSEEYLADIVQSFYLRLLDRAADTTGQGFFVSELQQGGTDQLVIASLAASDEYFAKTAAE